MFLRCTLVFLFALVALFSHVTGVLAQEETGAEEYLRRHIERAKMQEIYRVGGEAIISHPLLERLYLQNKWQLLWKNPESVAQLFRAIEESELEGLTPSDYHLPALHRLQQQIATGMDYPTLMANYDLLLSNGFIRLAYDKYFGKVDPKRLNPYWNLSEKSIVTDPAAQIANAIFGASVDRTLAGLSPHSSIYLNLKRALAKYRRIRDEGGWPLIADGSLMKPGTKSARIVSLRQRLIVTGELASGNKDSQVFDRGLQLALRDFQQRHYLDADGIPGKQTLAALNTSVTQRINQIRINLERSRWILHNLSPTCILIDIAGYNLTFYRDNEVFWRTRVVVGKPYHRTPIFASAIKYLVINPTWTIPRSIIEAETLPKIQKNPDYLQQNNLQVLDYQRNPVDSSSFDWQSYSRKKFPYLIRQNPGPQNALGRIKFILPNKHAIYLHDTPSRALFAKGQRAFSHGCIRVSDPLSLGELLLRNDGQAWDRARIEKVIESNVITRVNLRTPIPILLLYWTVKESADGEILFKQDVYGRDKPLLEALDGTFKFRSSFMQQK